MTDFGAVPTNEDLGTGPVKVNFDTVDPGITNDNTENYAVNSQWTNTTSGDVFTCTDASTGAAVWVLTGSSAGTGGSVLFWGNDSIAATTTTRFVEPGFNQSTAPTAPNRYRSPKSGIAKNLRARHNTPAGNGNAVVYTLRVNGVASALTASLASTSSDANDVANEVTIATGDLLDIEVTKALMVGGGGAFGVTVVIELSDD